MTDEDMQRVEAAERAYLKAGLERAEALGSMGRIRLNFQSIRAPGLLQLLVGSQALQRETVHNSQVLGTL